MSNFPSPFLLASSYSSLISSSLALEDKAADNSAKDKYESLSLKIFTIINHKIIQQIKTTVIDYKIKMNWMLTPEDI